MANVFYNAGVERAAKVNDLFTRIAPRYDLINDLQSFGLHRHWKRRVTQLAQVRVGLRALDVCCGTGDIALALARSGADVVGLDFNQRMLEVAGQRLQKHRANCQPDNDCVGTLGPLKSSNPLFLQGDAERLTFDNNTFDIVTVGYGLRNLTSWQKGLAEMVRVAKPGGRLIVLEFGKPKNALWQSLYYSYLRLFVPLLGWIFCGSASAYAYILESLKNYPAQRGVEGYMRQVGLKNVQVTNFLGGVMSINYGEKEPHGVHG